MGQHSFASLAGGPVRWIKLLRGVKATGVVILGLTILLIYFVSQILQASAVTGIAPPWWALAGPIVFPAVVLAPVLLRFGRYRRPRTFRDSSELVRPLIQSDKEFCLILRPFGHDGRIILPHFGYGASTIEQVISDAVRDTLGQNVYAIVDQKLQHAPPGPVYLRATNDSWRDAVLALICRAHSIILLLPPGQDIRDSFNWEINQIARLGLASRVVVLIPPDHMYPTHYPTAFHYANVIMATLEGFAGSVQDVDPVRVDLLERSAVVRTHVLFYRRKDPLDDPELVWGFVKPRPWSRPTRIGRANWVRLYRQLVSAALRSTERELADCGFRDRYPWYGQLDLHAESGEISTLATDLPSDPARGRALWTAWVFGALTVAAFAIVAGALGLF